MGVPVRVAGVAQRVLEDGQQRFGGDVPCGERGDVAQEATGRGLRQGRAGAVVWCDVPAVKGCGDLTCQGPVRGDECGGLTVLRGLSETQRDGFRLEPGGFGFDQREIGGGRSEVAQRRAVGQPLIGDGRGA